MLRPLGVFLPADDFISREDYKDGDLLEIDRKLYSHWVVSIGHDDVVNLPEATNNNCCVVVEHVPLLEVAHNCHVRVNNKQVPAKDRGLQDVSQKDVVNNALNSVGRTVSYNFFSSNSEHFVTRLKYGVGWSDQARFLHVLICDVRNGCSIFIFVA